MRIERTEYEARQAAARKLAQERGFSALVAWSRGGSTQDHYADVYYLTGFYTHQPFIPDEPGRWRARPHRPGAPRGRAADSAGGHDRSPGP
jgi:hypothetical protein